MNRRGFIGRMIGALGATIVAPHVFTEAVEVPFTYWYGLPATVPAPVVATISEYADFCNFSGFVVDTKLDAEILELAEKMGQRAAERYYTILAGEGV